MAEDADATTPRWNTQDEPVGNSGTLPAGARIGKYEIAAVLGQGSFGITYRARDTLLDRDVAIKEYLPTSFAVREPDSRVLPRSTQVAEDFRWGRERFLAEAKTLARLEDAVGIVNVYDFMEANGTAYMVMALVRGETLEARLRRERVLPAAAIAQILPPLLDGLERVHEAGFLHRDIKPSNILIDASGRSTLIDFGASRAALQGRTQTLTAVYTPGYAAFEQFTATRQGPWTDIYALGATLYHCVTGVPPLGASDRMIDDVLVPVAHIGAGHYPPGLLMGIDAALKLKPAERPQSIAAWRRPLLDATSRPTRDKPARMAMHWYWVAAVAAVVVLCLGAGGYLWWLNAVEADAWMQARAAHTEAAYRDYLAAHPEGRYAGEARQALGDLEEAAAWSRAAAAHSEAAYRDYLAAYPNGLRAADARKAIADFEARRLEAARYAEDAAWAAAKATRTIEALRAYLQQYPSGRYAAQALELISAIEREPKTRDCAQCPEMVRIPPGSFIMGSTSAEQTREGIAGDVGLWELPRRRVTISYGFSLGKYEVTRGEFAAFVQATGHRPAGDWRNPGFSQTDRDPVVNVGWYDAQAYAAWLSRTTGKRYRLPSEAEWEYAARAGTTTARYWGDRHQDACRYANVEDTSHGCRDGYTGTAPAGRFQPNPFGLHDMLGNVWEYTEDCWNESYAGAPVDGVSWLRGDCNRRVVRGGSWDFAPQYIRTASRNHNPIANFATNDGFRVARSD